MTLVSPLISWTGKSIVILLIIYADNLTVTSQSSLQLEEFLARLTA